MCNNFIKKITIYYHKFIISMKSLLTCTWPVYFFYGNWLTIALILFLLKLSAYICRVDCSYCFTVPSNLVNYVKNTLAK